MKKFPFLLLAFIFTTLGLWAIPSQNVSQYTLENGLEVFLLEDNATPLVRIEFCVRAGFSSQTKDNAGYFKLYSRLIEQNAVESSKMVTGVNANTSKMVTGVQNFDQVQCNADSSRFLINTTAPGTEKALSFIAESIFEANFDNELLTKEFTKMQQEVRTNLDNPTGFLNAAIDSRVFSEAPWKHDSGVYAPLFTKIQKSTARSILNTIKNKWYTPQNSAIFISGNIKKDETINLVQAFFGDYYFSSQKPTKKKQQPINSGRKFVIHGTDFSKEMTQIVIQYTNQTSEACDLAAATLSSDYSFFKNYLLNIAELNIPGYEYIDAASVQNEDNSRLIIQSIMENPSNKKISSAKQADFFIQATKQTFMELQPDEFQFAKQNLIFDMDKIETSSSHFMEKLASFWAIEPFYKTPEEAFETKTQSIFVDELLSRKIKINRIIQNDFIENFIDEEPFVFVIINSADYKKNKKEYDKLGFEEITKKNAVWYNQKIFEQVLKNDEETLLDLKDEYQKAGNQIFYNENLAQIQKTQLTNGIPVTAKFTDNFSKMTLLLSIRGGQLYSPNEPGFEEIMIHFLAANIQNECVSNSGFFKYELPKIEHKTNMASSYITLEFYKEDFELCCSCISNALIYTKESPAIADRIVAAKQYQKRLYNGSSVNQLFDYAVQKLYPMTDFVPIFNAKDDVLTEIQFQKIMSEYPRLLDASRYSVIITGDYAKNYTEVLDSTLGLLTARDEKIIFPVYEAEQLKNRRASVKITHTFLTDIPAEKAPPMPAVLIPTTEFLDPVMYVFQAPAVKSEDFPRFNALLVYLCKMIQAEIDSKNDSGANFQKAKVSVALPRSQMDCAALIIQNVAKTKEADEVIKNAIQKLKEGLLLENDKMVTGMEVQSNGDRDEKSGTTRLLDAIKSEWTISQMELTDSNNGTAALMQRGLEYLPLENDTEFYLDEFKIVQNGDRDDFVKAFEFLEAEPLLCLYSKDSKK